MRSSSRADVWTAFDHAPDLSIADVARKASCSFATGWQAAQDCHFLARPARMLCRGEPP